jgi:hypothetical protein
MDDPPAVSYRRHFDDVYRFVRRRTTAAEAEELTQDVFAAAAVALAASRRGAGAASDPLADPPFARLRGLRKCLGQMDLDQRVREVLLAENDLEAIALKLCPGRALLAEPLALRNEPMKRVGELLNLHVRSLALRRPCGHIATLYP